MATTFVLMAGLPGTGKTTLAQALVEATGGVVLSKDTIRAALFPGSLTDYSEEQDDLCFRALLDAATYIAKHAVTPIDRIYLDGRTFRKRSQIEGAINAAREARADWRILYLTCPDDVALARIAKDLQSASHPAGNRNARLYLDSKAGFETIEHPNLRVDTAAPLNECLNVCIDYLGIDNDAIRIDASKPI